MSTFNGFGTKLYGRAQKTGDTFVVTKWVVALYFPIWPLRSMRIRVVEDKFFTVLVYSSSNRRYQILETIPLRNNLGQILRTWAWTLVPAAYFVLWPVIARLRF